MEFRVRWEGMDWREWKEVITSPYPGTILLRFQDASLAGSRLFLKDQVESSIQIAVQRSGVGDGTTHAKMGNPGYYFGFSSKKTRVCA